MVIDTTNEDAFHNDYFIGDLRVFSDINMQGTRMRTAYDAAGRVGARRIDASDGRSMSDFRGRLGEDFRVSREKGSITVLKKDAESWVRVKAHDECMQILKREREVFTPPNFALRLPL